MDIYDIANYVLYSLCVYFLVIILKYLLLKRNILQAGIYVIYIIVTLIIIHELAKTLEEKESVMCLGFLTKIDDFNDNHRDKGVDEDTLFTQDDIKVMERVYTCGCSEKKDIFLRPEKQPENKKSRWMGDDGVIVEQTYIEKYGDTCDENKCKLENRPLERCINKESCIYPGAVCYKHPSFLNGDRAGISADTRGICIAESSIYHLEEIIDTYNTGNCNRGVDGAIDYNCVDQWDTRDGNSFINSDRDILGNISGRGLSSVGEETICYHPIEEKKQVSSYDEANHKYIQGTGAECCVQKEQINNHGQDHDLLDSLRDTEAEYHDAISEMMFYAILEELSTLALKTGARWLTTGESVTEAFSNIIRQRNIIVRAVKGSVVKSFKLLKGIIQLLRSEHKAADLAKILVDLASKFKNGLEALNNLRKAAQLGSRGGARAAEAAIADAAAISVAEKSAEEAASKALAAGAAGAGEAMAAEVGELAAGKTAAKVGANFAKAIPMIGQALMAAQLIGMAMDESGYGGYENIIQNRQLIEQLSDLTESQFISGLKSTGSNPPYSVDFQATFFSEETPNAGSSWPFSLDEVSDSSDKTECQRLVDLVKYQKQKSDMIMKEMFASQVQLFVNSFDDEEFTKRIFNELNEISNNPDSTQVESNMSDYFAEYLANYIHYHYTQADAQKRDQDIYDYILNKVGLNDDSNYKDDSITGVYHNTDALIYLNKELSSAKYSGILFTKKAVNLYNRYRNLRAGQQYVAYSQYYLDIAYTEPDPDHPNGEKHHLKKVHVRDSYNFSELNLSSNNPIFVQGMAQLTGIGDLVATCQYGNKLGAANYARPGLHGMAMAGVHGSDLYKTWLKGGEAPDPVQPFATYPNLSGALSCRDGCNENYNEEGISEEQIKMRNENYQNRIMSWNYANKGHTGENWRNISEFDPKNSALIANMSADHVTVMGPHDLVMDDDNRICNIGAAYCNRAGNYDRKFHNQYGGDHSNTTNYFEQPYGNNNREYNDCEPSTAHEYFAFIFGDSLTNTVSRWFS
jgi:hypothetical protein